MADSYDVLLVEDSSTDEELAMVALNRLNPRPSVQVARDGQDAIRMLSGDALPRLVLLDLKLPRVSGFDVLQQTRTHTSAQDLPIVAFSSSDLEQDIARVRSLGGNGFVTKPIGFREYLHAIQSVVTYWLAPTREGLTPPTVSHFTVG